MWESKISFRFVLATLFTDAAVSQESQDATRAAICFSNKSNFKILSTKGVPLMRFKNKLFVCRKRSRYADCIIHKCYWYCSSTACKGSVAYCIDGNNIYLNQDDTSIAILRMVWITSHQCNMLRLLCMLSNCHTNCTYG